MEPVIQLDAVTVHYRRALQSGRSLKEFFVRRSDGVGYQDVLALREVSLCVQRGEVVGILGANGSGKSTLLKVISRVLRPTSGRVRVRGRVASLIELGGGFNAELTGRENIFLESAILGFSYRETAARVAAIIEFAGLHDCIDTQLRTYSTGQVARLGFAVATAVQPEVLIIDEVLSVGDAEFQQRSFRRIEQFRTQGSTILIVSHQMPTILRLCDRAAWLDHGTLQADGPTAEVATTYQHHWSHQQRTSPAPGVASPRAGVALHLDGAPELYTRGWHAPERSERYGRYRWTGPETRSTVLLPISVDAELVIRIGVLHVVAPDVLASLRILVNDYPVPMTAEQSADGLLVFEGRVPRIALNPGAAHIPLTLVVQRTAIPYEHDDQRYDPRQLGVAIAWVQAIPLLPTAADRGMEPDR